MKHLILLSLVLSLIFSSVFSQEKLITIKEKQLIKNNTNLNVAIHPSFTKKPVGFAISGPLNKVNLSEVDINLINNNPVPFIGREDREIQPGFTVPDYKEVYKNKDGIQLDFGTVQNSKGIVHNYNGQTSGSFPPDCNGEVGPTHYFQTVNLTYAIYLKSTGALQANGNLNSIFDSSLPGAGNNDGDPIVLWDEQASRWLYVEFSISGSNDYMLVAVSTTSDPTGTWYSWSFDVTDVPDYMKLGIWDDGYYMATNTSSGTDVYVFERDVMIAGGANPQMIAFDNPSRPSTFDGFHCIMPLDNDGPWAPASANGGFITIADDGQSNPADELRIYECVPDWTTPSNSTFAMTQQLPVNSFAGQFDAADWNNIPQPGTSQQLDGISTVLMYRAQYRNFSGTEKIVCTHTIAETGTEGAIRWYILERTAGTWSINQQGTYNPGGADDVSRWLPSIAMNGSGQVALGFSISSPTSTIYPGIHIIGRSTCAPANTMDIAEFSVVEGGTYQSTYERWGDYANMSVDPSDDYTFWYTNEYMNSSNTTKYSRIAAFTLDESCAPPTVTNVSPTSLYEDRGKQLTITGSDMVGCTFTIGGVAGSVVSNDGSTAVVTFPAGNYTNGTLTVTNGAGSDNSQSVTINTRNTIPVVSGASATSDNHPTIESAVDGLYAWYGTTAFNAGDLAGTKTIEVSAGTYTEGASLTAGLNPTAANPLIIQPATGATVIVDATGNNYGFDLSTVDYVQLKGFTVHSANLDNIYALGDNVTISYNKTYGSVGGSGIKAITGTPFTIQNNLSYNNYKYGIHINTNNNIVKNNTTYNNGGTYTPATGVEIFNEIFTDGAGWTTDGTWSFYTGTSGSPSGDPVAGIEAGTGYIYSPVIDVTGYNNLTITNYYRSYGTLEATDDIAGAYSFDNTNWTTFFTDADDQATWITASVSGITPSSNSLYLRFFGDVDASEYWVIDDVTVTGDEAGPASNAGAGLYVESGTNSTVQNNVFVAKSGNDSYYALQSASGATVSSSYNTYYTTNTNLFNYNGTIGNTGPISTGDITTDPQFVNAGTDFHIKSTAGSYAGGTWPPLTATGGTWTNDAASSPSIDAGNPADAYANEPADNGSRINQGSYGNTVQASKSAAVVAGLWTGNTSDDWATTSNWSSGTIPTSTDNVTIPASRPHYPLINEGGDVCQNLEIQDGGSVTLTTGGNLAVGGTITLGGGATGVLTITDGTLTSTGTLTANAGSNLYITSGTFSPNAVSFNASSTVTYNGASQTASNWTYGNLVFNGTGTMQISGTIASPTVCQNMTINNSGNVLNIAEGKALTVNGAITNNAGTAGLVINSNAAGTGSLIHNSGAGVNATVYRYLESGATRRWHFVSSPIASATASNFTSTSNLYQYDESTNDYWTDASNDAGSVSGWLPFTAGAMLVNKGYAYNYYTESLNFAGQLNTNTATNAITVNYTNNGVTAPNGTTYQDFDGWNFIGNPYTSAIDWDNAAVNHAGANLLDGIYIYDDAVAHTYTSYVNGVGTNGGTQYIPAMQGFFVKGDASETSGTLTIGAAARIHNTQAFWKTNYETPENFIRLKITANSYSDETVIRLSEGASNEVDNGLDAYKMFTWDTNVPQIYTNSNNNTDYSINTVNTLSEGSVSIPLKVIQTGGTYSIQITEFNSSEYKVYLKDNLNNESIQIGLDDIFNFSSDETDDAGRYEIIFEKNTLDVLQAKSTFVTLFPNPNSGTFYLTLDKTVEDYIVTITNTIGQTIYNNKFNNNLTKEINLKTAAKGLYFVKIEFSDKSIVNKKIVIE